MLGSLCRDRGRLYLLVRLLSLVPRVVLLGTLLVGWLYSLSHMLEMECLHTPFVVVPWSLLPPRTTRYCRIWKRRIFAKSPDPPLMRMGSSAALIRQAA